MRAYLPVTPLELQAFVTSGSLHATQALIVDPKFSQDAETTPGDQEELEFEISWEAAVRSRDMQAGPNSMGFVLAVDLEQGQVEGVQGNEAGLTSDVLWPQVQSLLLSESEEPELSWFAPQEIPTYLPQWLA